LEIVATSGLQEIWEAIEISLVPKADFGVTAVESNLE